ncbi:MnhB domain-containing protein [Microtetraspora fusca]|uniref:MnhB domain-containing protein n=1 Tax=Microtetraspora fusca TaxID=1997 RepID=A0ABW6VIG8_MICFU
MVGAAALLRPVERERERPEQAGGRLLDAIGFGCYLLLPMTLLIGLDVVAHGHLTPGGGFQGGVVLATGLHLVYLAERYRSLERLRPTAWYEFGEGAGTALFVAVGLAGLAAGRSFLANVLPFGTFRALLSAGTVPVLNIVVGCAVGTGAVVLLAHFLETEAALTRTPPTMLAAIALLVAGGAAAGVAVGLVPGFAAAAGRAGQIFADRAGCLGQVLYGAPPRPPPPVAARWTGSGVLYGVASTLLAGAVAAAALWLPSGVHERARRSRPIVDLLHRLHSGHLGDYVAWLLAGAAALAAALAGLLSAVPG